MGEDGRLSQARVLGWNTIPFFDGRAHLKQNLSFLLRVATPSVSFRYKHRMPTRTDFIENPTAYAYASFVAADSYWGTSDAPLREFQPFDEHYRYRNFVFDATRLNSSGHLHTGLTWESPWDAPTLWYPATNQFVYPTNVVMFPTLLNEGSARWLYWHEFEPWSGRAWDEIGITQPGDFVMSPGYRNLFGLEYLSAQLAWGNTAGDTATLAAGGSIPAYDGFFYPETETAGLLNSGYYFGQAGRDWLPGHTSFSPTNTTPVLITSVGDLLYQVAGYAKLAVTNGYTGVYGYLGQYFEQALKMTNGVATTNQTGILSPYGEFFPTEPRPTALVTMPDLETNERGTVVVHVVKLQLDVNHDGEMDLSFAGPDNTSQHRPFVFWVNNDYDRLDDDLSSNDSGAYSAYAGGPTPDNEYYIYPSGNRKIPSLRDLEDFARLWICGITTNLYPELPAGVTAELSWGDKGNPNPNNPTVDIFGTADSDGGIGYLTNFATALTQTNHTWYAGRLGPGDSIGVLHSNSSGGWQSSSRAIWCGVKKGSGKLTLTFRQGTNTLVEASAYIEIKDIKEMYERWTVGDIADTSPAPANQPYPATDGLPVGASPFQYTATSDTNTTYILLVHDYDLPTWKKDRYAETAFKRLYWQGYEGRFGLFRWPGVTTGLRPLDDSEFNAWRSAAGLLNRLTNLNAQYPGNVHLMAHGYGAIAAGEALRLAGTNELVNTYIAMQGAVAAHAYDPLPSLPWRTLATGTDDGTPNRYIWYYTNFALPYFSGVGGAGAYINFFNTNDFVLTNSWRTDQDTKPALTLNLSHQYRWDGTNFLKGFSAFTELLLFPGDRYEIFSYCVEARAEASGAQPNLGGKFDANRELNLSTLTYSASGGTDHSGQFKSFHAYEWTFWRAVLTSMGLNPQQ